ncbi:MAG: hypothetical protein HY754_05720 [Nitrospirae bacterium]|nr:hypothetical protein [Nitrospirota bacterium]
MNGLTIGLLITVILLLPLSNIHALDGSGSDTIKVRAIVVPVDTVSTDHIPDTPPNGHKKSTSTLTDITADTTITGISDFWTAVVHKYG